MRKLALATALMVWLFPLQSIALGLGDITAKSYLNQPLNAELSLHSLRAGDLEELEVRMADQRDYQRAQIPWQDWMSKVKFSVERNAKGVAFVRMTTKDVVREPFLNFLVKAVWANGRVLKQYTLLVDPVGATVPTEAPLPMPGPSMEQEAPQTARVEPEVEAEVQIDPEPLVSAEPQRRAAEPEPRREEPPAPRRVEPAPRQAAPQIDSEPESRETFSGPSEIRTQKGDYAWRIAEQMRTDENVSIQQLLMGLLQANPDAFVDNNVNRLKSGVLLKRPSADQLAALNRQDAVNELAKQNALWRQYQQAAAQSAGDVPVAQTDRSGESAGEGSITAKVEQAVPQFEVLSAKDQNTVRGEIKLLNESISSKLEEEKELQSKAASLESQIKQTKSLIEVQMQTIAAKKADDEPTLERLEREVANGGDVTKSVIDEAQLPTPTTPKEDLEIIDEPQEPSGIMTMLNNPKVVGLLVGIVLVFGALVWIVRRRSMNLDEFQESILTNAGANTNSELTQTLSSGGGLGASSAMSDFASSSLTSGIQSEVNVMDPMAEADVYLAYGRFQHAEELMKEAIAKEPGRLEYKGKLLEIYSAMKEKQGFINVATELNKATGGKGPLWEKVHNMGRSLCPDNALFGGKGKAAVSNAGGAADRGRLDQTMVLGDTSRASMEDTMSFTSHEVPNLDETMHFDFNTGGMDQSTDFNFSAPQSGRADSRSNIIDFDLDRKVSAHETLDETTIIRPNDGGYDFNQFGGGKKSAVANAPDDHFMNFQTLSEGDHELPPLESTQFLQPGAGRHSGGNGSSSLFDEDMDEATLFSDIDEVGTKLDLARAYIDMGDPDGARSILGEVIEEGNSNQKQEANQLLSSLG